MFKYKVLYYLVARTNFNVTAILLHLGVSSIDDKIHLVP